MRQFCGFHWVLLCLSLSLCVFVAHCLHCLSISNGWCCPQSNKHEDCHYFHNNEKEKTIWIIRNVRTEVRCSICSLKTRHIFERERERAQLCAQLVCDSFKSERCCCVVCVLFFFSCCCCCCLAVWINRVKLKPKPKLNSFKEAAKYIYVYSILSIGPLNPWYIRISDIFIEFFCGCARGRAPGYVRFLRVCK